MGKITLTITLTHKCTEHGMIQNFILKLKTPRYKNPNVLKYRDKLNEDSVVVDINVGVNALLILP